MFFEIIYTMGKFLNIFCTEFNVMVTCCIYMYIVYLLPNGIHCP